MSDEYRKRTAQALAETCVRLGKVDARLTFDAKQEAEKQTEIAFLTGHIAKLQAMLA